MTEGKTILVADDEVDLIYSYCMAGTISLERLGRVALLRHPYTFHH